MSAKPHRHTVIADVAEAAGVSISTVSRVMSGGASVSNHKRERVLAAAERLGYRPSVAAQILATGNSRTIGVLTANTRRLGYVETLEGIEVAARDQDNTALITLLKPRAGESVRDIVAAAVSRRVAGFVVIAFDDIADEALACIPSWCPTVLAGSGSADSLLPRAKIEEAPAAYELVRHLLDLGHETVHHVRLPYPVGAEDSRTIGWRTALKDAGRLVPEPIDVDWGPANGYAAGRELLKDRTATAVFCGNDDAAAGVIRAVHDAGLSVPDDMSVVGFDNNPLSDYLTPPLSTASLDFEAMGRAACELLLRRISEEEDLDAPESGYRALRAEVRLRRSTAVPRVRSSAGAGD